MKNQPDPTALADALTRGLSVHRREGREDVRTVKDAAGKRAAVLCVRKRHVRMYLVASPPKVPAALAPPAPARQGGRKSAAGWGLVADVTERNVAAARKLLEAAAAGAPKSRRKAS